LNTPAHCFKAAPLLAIALTACATLPAIAQSAASTVVYVSSGDVVVKRASDGQLLNYTVSPTTIVSVDGKKLPASGLKPGTKLTDALPGTPKTVSEVSIAKGKVYQVDPPDKVTLSLASGIKELTVPAGTTFTVAGQPIDIGKLQKGMDVEATVVTLAAADATAITPPASTPDQTGTILLAITSSEPTLPEAGTNRPLFGILGFVTLMLGLGLRSGRLARINA
jgi:hypothetical protein